MDNESPRKETPKSGGKQSTNPSSNESQVAFLISCIRHSDNGKVDFGKVADDCDIVTKGAAAKRYERLLKAHGAFTSQSNGSPRETTTPSRKKRKTGEGQDGGGNGAESEDVSVEAKVKPKKPKMKKESTVKADPDSQVE